MCTARIRGCTLRPGVCELAREGVLKGDCFWAESNKLSKSGLNGILIARCIADTTNGTDTKRFLLDIFLFRVKTDCNANLMRQY